MPKAASLAAPVSDEGKAVSSRNSLKLGIAAQSLIIPGEDPDHLANLATEYEQHYHPAGPVESALLADAVRAHWMKLRYIRIEAEVIRMRAAAHPDPEHAVAAAFDQDVKCGNTLQRLFRRQQAADRDWRDALQTLEALQRHRKSEVADEPETAHEETAHEQPPAPVPGSFCTSPRPAAGQPAAEPPENLALRL